MCINVSECYCDKCNIEALRVTREYRLVWQRMRKLFNSLTLVLRHTGQTGRRELVTIDEVPAAEPVRFS